MGRFLGRQQGGPGRRWGGADAFQDQYLRFRLNVETPQPLNPCSTGRAQMFLNLTIALFATTLVATAAYAQSSTPATPPESVRSTADGAANPECVTNPNIPDRSPQPAPNAWWPARWMQMENWVRLAPGQPHNPAANPAPCPAPADRRSRGPPRYGVLRMEIYRQDEIVRSGCVRYWTAGVPWVPTSGGTITWSKPRMLRTKQPTPGTDTNRKVG